MNKKLSTDDVLQIKLEYLSGDSAYTLANKWNVHRSTIAKRLKKIGVEMRCVPIGSFDNIKNISISKIIQEYIRGDSATTLAKKYQISRSTVTRLLHNEGVKIRLGQIGGKRYYRGGGYLCAFSRQGKDCYIHRACWEAYYGEIPRGYIIHHIDGDKINNQIENLECITSSEHTKIHHLRGDLKF